MPSASMKPEQKPSLEATDPIKTAINLVDKKIRNLEKRKVKLDAYKKKQDDGEQLNADQVEAVERYDGVTQNLEFSRDLHKSLVTILNEADKQLRKQRKREQLERAANELSRIRQLLQLQSLLDSMGSDQAREHFKTGKHGAVMLTEENLNQLDELYKLICPSRENETSFSEQLDSAAEHIQNFLEAKDKEVVGTTFQSLNAMCRQITECRYFDSDHSDAAEAEDEGAEEEPETEAMQTTPVNDNFAEVQGLEGDNSEQNNAEQSSEVAAVMPTSTLPEVIQQQQENVQQLSAAAAGAVDPDEDEENADYQDSFFSTGPPYHKRAFNEIVSSVQGSFDFLQESHLDVESPHMDPAVLAAHPIAGGILQSQQHTADSGLGQSTFQSVNRLTDDSHQVSAPVTQSANNSHAHRLADTPQTNEQLAGVYDSGLSGAQPQAPPRFVDNQTIDSSFAGSEYLSHGLPSSVSALHGVEDSSSLGQQREQQGGDASSSAALQMSSQSKQEMAAQNMFGQGDMSQNKKPFTMNADAAVFTSMYSAQGGQAPGGSSEEKLQHRDFHDNSTYQNSGFGRGGQRGGQRGGRGGQRGAGSMSNGFSRGGSRGGGSGFNGRGGGYNNSRGSYQGYSASRNDFQGERYQSGYNNGFSSTGGFNKRGGGAPPRGGPGRGAAMRGNGAVRGSNPRGGRGGGFGGGNRMSSGQQQQQPTSA